MSDTMLLGVLRMPVAVHGDLDLAQLIGRAREAADRIEADARRIAELEADVAMLGEGMAALSAHVERMIDAACSESAGPKMRQAIDDGPATSLARLKAKWQAEALEQAANGIEPLSYGATSLRNRADELRRQAEEATLAGRKG